MLTYGIHACTMESIVFNAFVIDGGLFLLCVCQFLEDKRF